MMCSIRYFICLTLASIAIGPAYAQVESAGKSDDGKPTWKTGVWADETFFPIAVWVQSPSKAPQYKAAGVNTYVGLWKGPTEAQLSELDKHGMRVVCDRNRVAIAYKNRSAIIAWMHGDEPDNAQPLPNGKGYGPPIPPAKIVADYAKLRAADPTRPILLNLGQGVAWDGWHGRGVRTNHPEDYPEYVKGADLLSFDIYPACHDHPAVAGKLWKVADGVTRLRKWTDHRKPVWACIECTRISNERAIATPAQVRAEVWMAVVRGATGIVYFCHQFKPRFVEAGLLAEPEILAAVTRTNRQIQRLAPILNCPTVADAVTVESPPESPVEVLCKRKDGLYLFAVAMRGVSTKARFEVKGVAANATVEALDEGRQFQLDGNRFADDFPAWGVRLYRVRVE